MINSNVATIDVAGTSELQFSAAYSFYWLCNQSDDVMYASYGEPVADAEGTYTIPAGGNIRIAGGMASSKINVSGNGKLMVIASNIAECPVNSAGGGNGGGENHFIPEFKIKTGSITYTPSSISEDISSFDFDEPFREPPLLIVTPYCPPDTYYMDTVTTNLMSVTESSVVLKTRYSRMTQAPQGAVVTINWVAMGV